MSVLDKDGLTYFQQKKYNPVKKDSTMMSPVGRDDNGKLWTSANVGAEKFGVSGVGGSSPTLTRLWDAAGLTVTPGTDQAAGASGFDNYAPFNRRKCVGSWTVENGKAVFTPQAYYGDADYTEDGTMGDYVAVDQPPVYWYEDIRLRAASGLRGRLRKCQSAHISPMLCTGSERRPCSKPARISQFCRNLQRQLERSEKLWRRQRVRKFCNHRAVRGGSSRMAAANH